MTFRRGIYIVPTDRWYIERTVWLISGLVLIAGTALAWWVDPRAILLVTATGLASMFVSLTGLCPVGNVLIRLGFEGKLSRPAAEVGRWYVMKTDRWYLERRIYLVVGFNLTATSLLALFVSRGWLFFTGFVGVASLWFAATGFCILANAFYRVGAEPRLAPDHCRTETRRPSFTASSGRRITTAPGASPSFTSATSRPMSPTVIARR